MPRFRQISEMLKLMREKERIRNIGIIAHIDHGKTTMTDSLLVEAGLLPSQMAGSARALDYLEEEQRRGITIKTANLSLLHQMEGSSYVINLIDTPGHVDFTGKVTRALRAVDGAVVVVDAVEEIMAQTETVTRQALEERVKPVLFINKVDRLIKEMRLLPDEIQKKLTRIINDFNNLIELYAEPQFKDKWKVDPEEGSVVFGSALHQWGLTLKTADRNGTSFSEGEIMDAYRKGQVQTLAQKMPLHTAILDMVVKCIPNPVMCQRYRVPKVWKGDVNSEIGQAMLNCDEEGPTVMCITAAQEIPNAGLVATGRVYAGSIAETNKVYLVEAGKEYSVQQVSMYMSAFREPVSHITAGNIAALTGLDLARAGETLVDAGHRDQMIPFEHVKYVSEPVMTMALEPKNPEDLSSLTDAMNGLAIEDPNLVTKIDRETGQCLISGLGELHLEVAINFLKRHMGEREFTATSPIAAYREGILKKGAVVMTKSPNKCNRFWIKVEPIDKKLMEVVGKTPINEEAGQKRHTSLQAKEELQIWTSDDNENVLACSIGEFQGLEETKDSIVSAFHWACRTGPLCEEPLRGVKTILVDAQIDKNLVRREPFQVMRAVSRGILGSVLTASPVLLEPVFNIEVTVPTQWFGPCSNIIMRRRGKIQSTQQKGALTIISGLIPVAETIGLTGEMRSATSGHAFWQFTFDHWERTPERLASNIISQIRIRRGLPPQVPKPETFVDQIQW